MGAVFTLRVGGTCSTPSNSPPTITAVPDQTSETGEAIDLLVTISDPDPDVLTVTATGMPAGVTFNTTTRRFQGAPTTVGSSTVTVTANDGVNPPVQDVFQWDIVLPLVNRPAGGPSSTRFDGPGLDVGWSFVDPIASITDDAVADGRFGFTLPLGTQHDPLTSAQSTGGNTPGSGAPRLVRTVALNDFSAFVSFGTSGFQSGNLSGNGIGGRYADGTTFRADVCQATNGCSTQDVVAYVQSGAGAATAITQQPEKGFPVHLHMFRIGSTMTFQFSMNKRTWTTCATFTEGQQITELWFYGFNADPSAPEYRCEIDEAQIFNTAQALPALTSVNEGSVVRTDVLALDRTNFNNPGLWTDGSNQGGSLSDNGTDLAFTITDFLDIGQPISDDKVSSAKALSVADFGPNIGVTGTLKRTGAADDNIYFGALLRGGSVIFSQYGAGGHVFEAGVTPTKDNIQVRVVAQDNTCPSAIDGGSWRFTEEIVGVTVFPLTATETHFRFEVIEDHFRAKYWQGPEPTGAGSFDYEWNDSTYPDAGKVGAAVSRNNDETTPVIPSGAIEGNLNFYAISRV